MRIDGRQNYDLRKCHIESHVSDYAEGSVYIEMGKTKVLCTASINEQIPKWLQDGSKRGWVTAEYGMLPRSTHLRKKRDQLFSGGKKQGNFPGYQSQFTLLHKLAAPARTANLCGL